MAVNEVPAFGMCTHSTITSQWTRQTPERENVEKSCAFAG